MNDITRTIVKSSMEHVPSIEDSIDELYEDVEMNKNAELEREVIKVAATTDMEELYPKKEEEEEEDEYDNPYQQPRHKSAEAEMQDRLLTIPRRPKNAPWGSLWVIHTGFIEQVALLNITKSEQRSLLRQWADIQVLSEGDGNADIVESEQDEFMLKIVSYKSRSDNPEKGVRERTAHITSKTIADQTIQMPKSEAQKTGFLNTILGRKVQQ